MTSTDRTNDTDNAGNTEHTVALELTVNGVHRRLEVPVRRTLAEVIREELGLTGTHLGCEHGVCGACTVALDGRPVRSCLMLAIQADGAAITTIEGLATDGVLHPIQQGMHDAHGFQCAFCAPGFLITAACLLDTNPTPTRDEIRGELSGNLCRCTGYASILDGVETAVRLLQADKGDDDA
ncbi:MAG: (2Fe-2S)-binding protein [Acidimicrobiales bacterium]